ncbi:hypothetical protein KWH41_23630 [Escherichia coli]|uniref:hypothetical protein n=1 Tax=Escherichia coli TaxID=562 RepID=UPI0021CFF48E|nr:hypothetical protein [Escherichia coli]MCU6257809.1 hypothetical protein [Escherichia coli]
MMNQNKEFLGNLMLEITNMKERMAKMESEIKSLKDDNAALRKSLKLIDETNAVMMDHVFPEWRNETKPTHHKKPTLRIVA